MLKIERKEKKNLDISSIALEPYNNTNNQCQIVGHVKRPQKSDCNCYVSFEQLLGIVGVIEFFFFLISKDK